MTREDRPQGVVKDNVVRSQDYRMDTLLVDVYGPKEKNRGFMIPVSAIINWFKRRGKKSSQTN